MLNLDNPDDVSTFGLFDSKSITGDEQIFSFKSITRGSKINLAPSGTGDSVQRDCRGRRVFSHDIFDLHAINPIGRAGRLYHVHDFRRERDHSACFIAEVFAGLDQHG